MTSSTIPADTDRLAERIAQRVVELAAKRPRLIDRHSLAQKLNVSVSTVDRLRKEGRIKSVLVGDRPMFDLEEVIADLKRGDDNEQ